MMLKIKYVMTNIMIQICEMVEGLSIMEKIGLGLLGTGMLLGMLGVIG